MDGKDSNKGTGDDNLKSGKDWSVEHEAKTEGRNTKSVDAGDETYKKLMATLQRTGMIILMK